MSELTGAIVFVTGAAGFLGRYVVSALAAEGAEVRALRGPPGQTDVIEGAVESFESDIANHVEWQDRLTGADLVVHLAGAASVADSFVDPEEYVRVHVGGTASLLEAVRKAGTNRVIHISSAEVYGCPVSNPVVESQRLEARSPYGAAKIGSEKLIEAWHWSFGQNAVILRPFSVYGPGASPRSLIAHLMAQAKSGNDITVQDIRPIRDYCYAGDFARAVIRACVAPISFGVFNIGTMKGVSVSDAAAAVLGAMDKVGTIRELQLKRRTSDIFELIADNRHAAQILGWHPETEFTEGLRITARSASRCDS